MANINIYFNGTNYSIDESILSDATAKLSLALADLEELSKPKYSVGLAFTSNGNGTCAVTGIGTCIDSDIIIPKTSPDGDNVTSIGDNAFKSKTSFTSVNIPDGVTTIGYGAFAYCTSLTSVNIPDSVTNIKTSTGSNIGAFKNCSKLTSVHINNIAAWCNISFGTDSSNPLCYAKNLYLNGELVTDLVIPDGVTAIGNYAFYNCTSLTSVVIPDGVTSIGGGAFCGCYNLTNVVIPNSVTSIGENAFWNCGDNLIIEYNGTKSRFRALTKGVFKDTYFTAHCSDGEIVKKKR
jgi:hypothetical protein